MFLTDIIDIIELAAPLSCQENWDNSGMQVGDRAADIRAVLLTTDVTEAVVSEAISRGCNLIISHHPLLFHGLKHLTSSTPQERCVEMAIRHDIAIYSAHTSLDSVLRGVSGRMADMLELHNQQILAPTGRMASGETYGLGVIGDLSASLSADEFLSFVRRRFDAQYVRYTSWERPVRRVAVCGGAGAEFVEAAVAAGADAYLTADCKYHEFCDAAGRILLVDIDHWVSEHHARDIFRELLCEHVPCYISERDASPIHCINL